MTSSLFSFGSAVLAGVLLLVLFSIVYVSWKNGISPMPSSAHVRNAVTGEIKRIAKYGTIVEAGAGWGTLGLYIARRCPGWRIIGIENSPVPLWVSRLSSRLLSITSGDGRARCSFIHGDIYTYSYKSADVVVCYLYPGAMTRLSVILGQQLEPGAKIISVCFALPGWHPERVITCRDIYRTKIYVYTAGDYGGMQRYNEITF